MVRVVDRKEIRHNEIVKYEVTGRALISGSPGEILLCFCDLLAKKIRQKNQKPGVCAGPG
jgi:hypothetical protein